METFLHPRPVNANPSYSQGQRPPVPNEEEKLLQFWSTFEQSAQGHSFTVLSIDFCKILLQQSLTSLQSNSSISAMLQEMINSFGLLRQLSVAVEENRQEDVAATLKLLREAKRVPGLKQQPGDAPTSPKASSLTDLLNAGLLLDFHDRSSSADKPPKQSSAAPAPQAATVSSSSSSSSPPSAPARAKFSLSSMLSSGNEEQSYPAPEAYIERQQERKEEAREEDGTSEQNPAEVHCHPSRAAIMDLPSANMLAHSPMARESFHEDTPLSALLCPPISPHSVTKAPPRRWTREEDESLRAAVSKYGERNWKAIAAKVPGRNHTQCLQRWTKVLQPGLIKGHWSAEEDELLRKLVNNDNKNWGQVAAKIPGRTSKQCRERWHNHLDPSIKRTPYTAEEDRIIIESHARLGNRWAQIAALLPGRTEDAVKIRWKSFLRSRKVGKENSVHSPEDDGMSSAASTPMSMGGGSADEQLRSLSSALSFGVQSDMTIPRGKRKSPFAHQKTGHFVKEESRGESETSLRCTTSGDVSMKKRVRIEQKEQSRKPVLTVS